MTFDRFYTKFLMNTYTFEDFFLNLHGYVPS